MTSAPFPEPTNDETQPAEPDQWDDAGPFVYRILPESSLAAFFTEERDMMRISFEDGGWWLAQDGTTGQSRYDTLDAAKAAGDEILDRAEAAMDHALIQEAGLSDDEWTISYRDGLTFESKTSKTSIVADTEPQSGRQRWDLYVDDEPRLQGVKAVPEALAVLCAQ